MILPSSRPAVAGNRLFRKKVNSNDPVSPAPVASEYCKACALRIFVEPSIQRLFDAY